jgi:hypothetical protein
MLPKAISLPGKVTIGQRDITTPLPGAAGWHLDVRRGAVVTAR